MENKSTIRCAQCGHDNPRKNVFCGICGSRLGHQPTGDSVNITLEDLTEMRLLNRALEGKFEILEELGRGGFGVVFKARDIQLERFVAIKALHLAKSGDQSLVKRFIKEARLSAKLEHPNIARIYTIDSVSLIHYFIMEFIEGPTIKDLLNERGVFAPYHVVKYGRDIARALSFAHEKGIIHRDIKPANVILKNEETAVVTDFGIAKALWSEATALTSGAIGTPIYMAPEQFLGKDIDGRADMYALGVLFYEMLTGEPPFMASGALLIQQQLHAPPPPITQRNPDVPKALVNIIERLLAKNPEDRYSDCTELLDVLNSLDNVSLPRESDIPTAGITVNALSVEQLIQDGKKALMNKNFDAALNLFNAAHEMDPDNVDVLFLMEQARLKKSNEENLEARIKEGIASFHEGKYTQAIDIWSQALEIDNQNKEIPKLIEQAKRRKDATNRGHELRHEALKALEQQRFDTAIHKLSAAKNFLNDTKNLDRMIEKARKEKLKHDRIQSLLDKALDLRKRRKYADALAIYRDILEIDPDLDTARKQIEKTIEEQKQFHMFHQKEQKWRRMAKEGRFNKVLAEIDECLDLFPDFKDRIINLKARIKLERQHADGIIRMAAHARELHEKGLYEKAQKIWEKIREQDPEHPILQKSAILTERALVQEKLKHHKKTKQSSQGRIHDVSPEKEPDAAISEKNRKTTLLSKRRLPIYTVVFLSIIVLSASVILMKRLNHRGENGPPSLIKITPTPGSAGFISGTFTPRINPGPATFRMTPTPVLPTSTPSHPPSPTVTPSLTPSPVPSPIPATETPAVIRQPTNTPAPPGQLEITPAPAAATPVLPSMQSIGSLIKTARSLADEKHYRKALRIIDDILIVTPKNVSALLMKKELEDVLERSRNMMQVARQVAREGQKFEADKIVERVLELDPFNPDAITWKQHGGMEKSGLAVLNIHPRPRTFRPGRPLAVIITVESRAPLREAVLYFRNRRGEWEYVKKYKQSKTGSPGRYQLIFIVPERGVSRIGLSVYVTVTDTNGRQAGMGSSGDPIFFFAGR